MLQLRNGGNFQQNFEGKGIPITRIETISEGFVNGEKVGFVENISAADVQKYQLLAGDILFSHINSIPHLGKTAVYHNDPQGLIHGINLLLLRPDQDIIDPNFLDYLMRFYRKKQKFLRIANKSVNQASINQSNLSKLIIPVPPLDTQRKIVAILEKAEATQSLRAEADALTQQLLQNVYMSIFGDPISNPQSWDIVKLECVCKIITDGEHATPKRSQSGIYLLSARNIRDHEIDLSDVDYIDDKEYDRISKRIVPQNGDVLISCSGSVGRVSRVKDDIKFQMVRSVALIRPDNQKLNSAYLEYAFDTTYLKMQIAQSVNQSSQANLFQGKIRELKIPLPPMDLQQIFADIVEKYEQLTESQRMTSRRALTLYSSLLSKAFTGELIA